MTSASDGHQDQSIPSPRRESLGFDMARIPPIKPHLPSIFEDSSSTMNPNKELDLQHIRRLQSINQNLRKLVIQNGKETYKDDIQTRITKVEQRYTSDLSNLTDTLRDLEEEKKQLILKMETVDETLTSLRRTLKSSNSTIHDLNVQIATAEAKFDFMEERVMKIVLQKEKSLNEALEKLQNQYLAQFHVIETQLKQELEQNQDYKDENIEENIAGLRSEKEELEGVLEMSKLKKIERIQDEEQKMEKELQMKLKTNLDIKNKHKDEIDAKRRRLTGIEIEVEAVTNKIAQYESQIEERVKKIDSWREKESSFGERKVRLKHQENQLQGELLRVQLQENEWDIKVKMTREQYHEIESKKAKQRKHLLMMEDAILNYKKKVRVYMRVSKVEDLEMITLHNREFKYDKVFSGSSFYEAQMMVESSLKGNNCRVYFAGAKGGDFVDFVVKTGQSLVEATEKRVSGWLFVYSIEQSGDYQRLKSLDRQELEKWAEGVSSLSMEEGDLKAKQEVRIKVEACNHESNKAFDSWISLTDVTSLALEEQDSVIRSLIDSQSKHLVIGNVAVDASTSFLEVFEQLGQLNPQYVHKEMF